MQSTSEPKAGGKGMPIYEDTHARSIVDALDEDQETDDWYPGNDATRKLWHCLEALRDIELVLEGASAQQDEVKKRRQLKQFSVQLHSLAKTVVNLCDQIAGDNDARRYLEKATLSQVSKIKTEFCDLVPIDHKGDLSVIRNLLGGHVDRNLSPHLASEILSRNAMANFGRWLHICIHALLDLMKLDIYAWSVRSDADDQVRFMIKEPYLVTFLCSGESKAIKAIIAVHLSKRSPRMAIADLMGRILQLSQWMFKSGEPRIGGLKIDESGTWNTFQGSTAPWRDPEELSAS